jgi:cysteine sulfinate desulfinase/cysteine desulfurase-like protein
VLEAMNAPEAWQTNAVRASFGWSSSEADVDALLEASARSARLEARNMAAEEKGAPEGACSTEAA